MPENLPAAPSIKKLKKKKRSAAATDSKRMKIDKAKFDSLPQRMPRPKPEKAETIKGIAKQQPTMKPPLALRQGTRG